MTVAVGAVVVTDVEAVPDVGRTGATGAGVVAAEGDGVGVERIDDGEDVTVEMAEEISVCVEVETAAEAAADEEFLGGERLAVTMGVTITVAVDCTSHPTPLQL